MCYIVILCLNISISSTISTTLPTKVFAQEDNVSNDENPSPEYNNCISYDNEERLVTITCPYTTNLTKIYNKLKNQYILTIENNTTNNNSNNTWILNAGLLVEKGATLVIDKSDTGWLKIVPRNVGASSSGGDDDNGDEEDASGESRNDKSAAYAISVLGSLKIDSVKMSSWDPDKKDYVKFEFDILPSREHEHTGIDAIPRPYIRVEEETAGTTNITNSEIAYMEYECGGGC